MNSLAKLKSLPQKLKFAIKMQRWQYTPPPRISNNPINFSRKVIFFSISPTGFDGPGKVKAESYFPDMCSRLQELGYACYLPCTFHEFCDLTDPNAIVILIYNETRGHYIEWGLETILSNVAVVFHIPEQSYIIRSKLKLSKVFNEGGIPTPKIIDSDIAEIEVSSNEVSSSGAEVKVYKPGEKLDKSRFNTENINSIFDYEKTSYYVMIRLLCVGAKIVTTHIKLRPISEGSPSVHTGETPVDATIINAAYNQIVAPNITQLENLAKNINNTLGYGFWAHDTLFESKSKIFYVCESGYKFVDDAYIEKVAPIHSKLIQKDANNFTGFAKISAEALHQVIETLINNYENVNHTAKFIKIL